MREFWVTSGHHLAQRTAQGRMLVTPELLLAYLARPELLPPPEACDAERALYAALRDDPLRQVPQAAVDGMKDADARENWAFFLRYRDMLVAAPSIEDAYLQLVTSKRIDLPPLFLDQMTHIILRNALDDCTDPFVLRGAELFFRAQRASLQGGALMLADLELVEEHEKSVAQARHTSPLFAMMNEDPLSNLDVMDQDNAWTYWSRSDANSMVMNLGGSADARAGLARAIEAWIAHLLRTRVSAQAIPAIRDDDWRWFTGLDSEGTSIGNAMWHGEAIEPERAARVAALFRLDFADRSRMLERVRGKPAYLILAMTKEHTIRMKPQNLVTGLPLVAVAGAGAQ
ncbi:MAG: hypothetical protein FJX29_13140 [Alphaproteobacteria bacterium]|nr:hypothetical protein [Alphaproteobacteria bacterium]